MEGNGCGKAQVLPSNRSIYCKPLNLVEGMTTAGVGLMWRIEGKMDAELYEEILEDHVFQTLEYYDLDPSNFILQQDNDPKHTSKRAKKWFEDHEVELLDWPA